MYVQVLLSYRKAAIYEIFSCNVRKTAFTPMHFALFHVCTDLSRLFRTRIYSGTGTENIIMHCLLESHRPWDSNINLKQLTNDYDL